MPRSQNPDRKGKKGPVKGTKKNKNRKKVTVLLPAIIPGQGPRGEEEPMSEHELSYEDALLAVKMEKLAAKGLTNDQIIEALGISRAKFYHRVGTDPYFSYCLFKHRGKAVADVENALYKNAVGFDYIEQQATASGRVVTILKQKLPETKAIEFFLTNRKADEWKKKVETTLTPGEGLAAITFSIKRYEE